MTSEEREKLKLKFHDALLALCDRTVVETKRKYDPRDFRRMVRERTGYETACHFLNLAPSDVSSGLGTLIILNKKELSLEHFAQQDPWHHLFTLEQMKTARLRLQSPTKGH